MQRLLKGSAYLRPGRYHWKYGSNYTFQKFLTYSFTIHIHSELIIEKRKIENFI